MQTDNSVGDRRKQAKANLQTILATYQGNTQHQAVVEAINQLAALNPTPNPAQNMDLLAGNWLLINAPNFPGRLEAEKETILVCQRQHN